MAILAGIIGFVGVGWGLQLTRIDVPPLIWLALQIMGAIVAYRYVKAKAS